MENNVEILLNASYSVLSKDIQKLVRKQHCAIKAYACYMLTIPAEEFNDFVSLCEKTHTSFSMVYKRIVGIVNLIFFWDRKQDVDVVLNDTLYDKFALSIDDIKNINLEDAENDLKCRIDEYVEEFKIKENLVS